MKITNIIYIFESRHYYKSDDEEFGIEYFRKCGYKVSVWSAVNWKYGKMIDIPKNIHDDNCVYFNNERELRKLLTSIGVDSTCFILYAYHTYDKCAYLIRKCLHDHKCRFMNLTLSFDISQIIPYRTKARFVRLFISNMSYFILGAFVLTLDMIVGRRASKRVEDWYYRFIGPIIYKSSYNFLICSNNYNYLPNAYEVFSKRSILVPSFDYAKYLHGDKEKSIVPYKYIVYIDNYIVGHSDFAKSGVESPITDKESYYTILNRFFDIIEENMGMRVVIAVHPKAEYNSNVFEGRDMFFYKTLNLIKYSEYTINTISTAFAWSVLYKKPYFHCASMQEMSNSAWALSVKNTQKVLQSKFFYYDDVVSGELSVRNCINYYTDEFEKIVTQCLTPEIGLKKDCFEIIRDYL